jgi:hypothetical protein
MLTAILQSSFVRSSEFAEVRSIRDMRRASHLMRFGNRMYFLADGFVILFSADRNSLQ